MVAYKTGFTHWIFQCPMSNIILTSQSTYIFIYTQHIFVWQNRKWYKIMPFIQVTANAQCLKIHGYLSTATTECCECWSGGTMIKHSPSYQPHAVYCLTIHDYLGSSHHSMWIQHVGYTDVYIGYDHGYNHDIYYVNDMCGYGVFGYIRNQESFIRSKFENTQIPIWILYLLMRPVGKSVWNRD